MNSEELDKIFDDIDSAWEGDNAMQGLLIIGKYFDKSKSLICAAEHDIIYSVSVSDILKAGLTEEDAQQLAKLNWSLDEYGCLSCFV